MEVSVVIIDEISMVLNISILHVHKRLCEIFRYPKSQSSGDLSFVVGGDFLQSPPIKSLEMFENYNITHGDIFNWWSLFLMTQLTEVMREKR